MTAKRTKPEMKKTCVPSSQDPDVKIVVGGKEFWEYSATLACWSSYFDRALNGSMREATTKEFNFPDRDPEEWEWIVSLVAPMTQEKVTIDKLEIALDWFDFLGCEVGLDSCDRMIAGLPLANGGAMRYLPLAVKYGLKKSKAACFRRIKSDLASLSTLNEDLLKFAVSMVKDNVECRSNLFGPLKAHLPSSITEDQAEALLNTETLATILVLEWKNAEKIRKAEAKCEASPTSTEDTPTLQQVLVRFVLAVMLAFVGFVLIVWLVDSLMNGPTRRYR